MTYEVRALGSTVGISDLLKTTSTACPRGQMRSPRDPNLCVPSCSDLKCSGEGQYKINVTDRQLNSFLASGCKKADCWDTIGGLTAQYTLCCPQSGVLGPISPPIVPPPRAKIMTMRPVGYACGANGVTSTHHVYSSPDPSMSISAEMSIPRNCSRTGLWVDENTQELCCESPVQPVPVQTSPSSSSSNTFLYIALGAGAVALLWYFSR